MSVAHLVLSLPCCIVTDLVINMSVVNCVTMQGTVENCSGCGELCI